MVYIVIIAILIYCTRTIYMFIGASKSRIDSDVPMEDSFPLISVIVPARNESHNIRTCMQSLAQSNYPINRFEIIAVNDRSEDNTLEILKELQSEIKNLKIVNITEESQKSNLRGKPGALQAGINQAVGELILMTDADCEVSPEWIKSISAQFNDKNVGLVSAFTLVKGKRIFDIVQAVEWIYMCTMSSAGVGWKRLLGCFGNNLSVRTEDFNRIGGYKKIKFSVTEDMALQKAVFESGHGIKYICSPETIVKTNPVNTFKEYISQHRRWSVGGLELGWKAAIFVVSSISIWLGLAISIYESNLFWIFSVLFVRFAGDYSLINSSVSILKQGYLRPWIIPSIAFFMLIELIIPFTVIRKNIVWKGQVFKR